MIRMIRATASMVLIILMATAAAAEIPVEHGRYRSRPYSRAAIVIRRGPRLR